MRWTLFCTLGLFGCLGEFPGPPGERTDASADAAPDAVGPDREQPDAEPDPDQAKPVLESIRIEPAAPTVRYDETLALRVVGRLSDGAENDVTGRTTWRVGDPEAAVIDEGGLLWPLAVGETTVQAKVGTVISEPVTLRVEPVPNGAPEARIVCPQDGVTREALVFDGAQSQDGDGQITLWLFDFGLGEPENDGRSPQIEHVFATPGRHQVKLTVIDDGGAAGQAMCVVNVAEVGAPEVAVIEPPPGTEVVVGAELTAVLALRPAAGRAIVHTKVIVDGSLVGEVFEAPFAVTFKVPDELPPGTEAVLVVEVEDDVGVLGRSAPQTLRVVGD